MNFRLVDIEKTDGYQTLVKKLKLWNLYQFETYAPMITGHSNVPEGKQASYERNRNLFYVCCSRPKKRLFFFVSVPIDAVFRAFLTKLVGTDNIYTYSQYLETD